MSGISRSPPREARAEGFISMKSATLAAIADGTVPKGEVLGTAHIAGIMAAKRCGELIPLCHPLPLESVEVDFDVPEMEPAGDLRSAPHPCGSPHHREDWGGMEALTAVTTAALTIYDMCKAIDKSMIIDGVRMLAKTGGTHTATAANPLSADSSSLRCSRRHARGHLVFAAEAASDIAPPALFAASFIASPASLILSFAASVLALAAALLAGVVASSFLSQPRGQGPWHQGESREIRWMNVAWRSFLLDF